MSVSQGQSQQSFRQTGIKVRGSVLRGVATAVTTTATIPSKFETVLHRDVAESRGFGSASFRFDAQQAPEAPGPGAYYRPKTMEIKSESISKKGMGNGFVSKTKRFKGWGPVSIAPGPGKYDPLASIHSIGRSTAPSAAFSKSVGIPVKHRVRAVLPGPGQYDPSVYDEVAQLKRLQQASSAFSSTSKRGIPLPDVDAPAPGSYDIAKPIMPDGSFARGKPTAAFRSGTSRLAPQIVSDGPGPGEYTLEVNDENEMERQVRPSSFFQVGNVDRFGKPLHPTKEAPLPPGPGSYETAVPPRTKALISSSFFMSGSERIGTEATERVAPGPGAYRPHLVPSKKSFHLNTTSKWV